jgi:hypothetical protein
MYRLKLPSIALATVVLAGCGTGGLNYWLYPEPHLVESEEAVFVTYENHFLQSMDGEETSSRCWGDRRPEAYTRRDVACRLHLQPGEHSAVFGTSAMSRNGVAVRFTAEPGKVFGLDRSSCRVVGQEFQQTCRLAIMEIEQSGSGG